MNGFSCDRCGKVFARSNDLKRHFDRKFQCDEIQDHFDKNDFMCEKCFKLFSRKDNLMRHMEACKKQQKIDDNQCEFCEKTYLNKGNLKRHLQTCKMKIFVKNNIQIDNSSNKTSINGDHNNVNKINVDKSQNQNNIINQNNIHQNNIINQTIINKYGSENTDYIDENFTNDIQIKNLATYAGISYRYYTFIFKRHKGTTVNAYIKNLRLNFSNLQIHNAKYACLNAVA